MERGLCITAAILAQEDTCYIRAVLESKCHEWDMNWYSNMTCSIPNRNLLRLASKAGTIKSPNIRTYAKGLTSLEFTARPATVAEYKMIQEGFRTLESLGLGVPEIEVATSLSEGVYSTVQDGEAYLSPEVFLLGQRATTGALLEAILKRGGQADYEIREYVLDHMIRMLEEKIGLDSHKSTRYEQVADAIESQDAEVNGSAEFQDEIPY